MGIKHRPITKRRPGKGLKQILKSMKTDAVKWLIIWITKVSALELMFDAWICYVVSTWKMLNKKYSLKC